MRLRNLITAAAFATAVFAVPAAAAASPISYTFDSSNQGWRQELGGNENPAVHVPAGGNPAGFIQILDLDGESGCPAAPCDFSYFLSPVFAPGTLAANYGGEWSFDYRANTAPTDYLLSLYIYGAAGDNLVKHVTPANVLAFQRVAVPLTESQWQYCLNTVTCGPASQAQTKGLLASATYLKLMVDTNQGAGELYGLDNVALTDGPPAPAATPVKKKKCKKGRKLVKTKKGKRKCKKKKRRKK